MDLQAVVIAWHPQLKQMNKYSPTAERAWKVEPDKVQARPNSVPNPHLETDIFLAMHYW